MRRWLLLGGVLLLGVPARAEDSPPRTMRRSSGWA